MKYYMNFSVGNSGYTSMFICITVEHSVTSKKVCDVIVFVLVW